MESQTDWIEANGVVMRYVLRGIGPSTVVLLHEMGGAIESWRQVTPLLPPEWRVLAYDLRGAGMSEKIAGTVTIDEFAGDLHALLAALSIPGPVVLVGSALGAAPAIRFAAKYPERTRGLVAFSPACGMAPDRREAAYDLADRAERLGVRAARPSPAGAPPAPPVRGLSYAAISLAGDGRSAAAWRRMLADLDMDSDFAKIACPALFIGGTQDAARPPAQTEAIARQVPGARYQELDTGHFAAWQTPELTAQAINAFLETLRA